jgi:hypothetical protein
MQILQFQCRKRIDGQRKKQRSGVHLPAPLPGGFQFWKNPMHVFAELQILHPTTTPNVRILPNFSWLISCAFQLGSASNKDIH